MAKKTGCKSGIVSFRTKRGKLIEFEGKHAAAVPGPACGPGRKSNSKKAAAVRKLLATAGKQCGKQHGYFTKASGACVRAAFKHERDSKARSNR